MKNIEKLAIGNFVRINGKLSKVYKLEPGLVNGIEISHVHGIPISKEEINNILGLELEGTNDGRWITKDGKITAASDISNRSNGAWWFSVDNDRFETIGGADIIFIHELQNFLNSLKEDE